MNLREMREHFLSKINKDNEVIKIINPELIQIDGQNYFLLFDNENMHNEEEISLLLRQCEIEGNGLIIVSTKVLDNPLITRISNIPESELEVMSLVYEEETQRYYPYVLERVTSNV